MANTQRALSLVVNNRDGVVYNGKVLAISSFNDKGKFDVLPGHANFISIINKSIRIITLDKHIQEVKIENGVLKVFKDSVEIFLGIKK